MQGVWRQSKDKSTFYGFGSAALMAARDAAIRGDTIVAGPGVYEDVGTLPKPFGAAIGTTSGDITRDYDAGSNRNIVTVTTTSEHGFAVGDPVRILGAADESFDGAYVVSEVASTTVFKFDQVFGGGSTLDADSQGGQALGLLSYWFAPGVTLYSEQSSSTSPLFIDSQPLWCTARGNAIIKTANLCLGTANQSYFEIEADYMESTSSFPAVYLNADGAVTVLRVNGDVVCQNGDAVNLAKFHRAHIRALRIRTVFGSSNSAIQATTSSASGECYIDADEISSREGPAINFESGSGGGIFCHSRRITGATAGVSWGRGPVVTLRADVLTASGGPGLVAPGGGTTGRLEVRNSRITTSNASSPAIDITAAANNIGPLILNNCTLVSGGSATYSISSSAAQTVRVYGVVNANKNVQTANVNQPVATVTQNGSVI